LKSRSFYLE